MTIAELKKAFKLIHWKKAVTIVSKHGMGKTSVAAEIAEYLNLKFVAINVGQFADSSDIIGLPLKEPVKRAVYPEGWNGTIYEQEKEKLLSEAKKKDKDAKTSDLIDKFIQDGKLPIIHYVDDIITTTAPPYWWPMDGKPIFLFLDEANRNTSKSVYNCLFQLILAQKLNGRTLPEGSRVMLAANPSTDDGYYDVVEWDPALIDRMAIYNFEPSFEELRNYMIENDFHPSIPSFLYIHRDCIDPITKVEESGNSMVKQHSRRSWEEVANSIKLGGLKDMDTFKNVLCGEIGSVTTTRYLNFLDNSKLKFEIDKIIKGKELETIKTLSVSEKLQLVVMLLTTLSEMKDKEIHECASNVYTVMKNYMDKESAALFYSIIKMENKKGRMYGMELISAKVELFNEMTKMTSVDANF